MSTLIILIDTAVMERLGFNDVLAFDAHFRVYRYGRDRQRALHRLPR